MNKKKIFLGFFVGLLLAQFIQTDKSTPEIISESTFNSINQPPAHLQKALKAACYDCHSYETKYPWYTYVAPVSWWIKGHVKNGRKRLNFSKWASIEAEDIKHIFHECAEEIESGHMPPKGYVRMHAEADLSPEIRQELITWLNARSR
jgi:hypothetical protein